MKIIESLLVSRQEEMQYKVDFNGKEIWISKVTDTDGSVDYEIFKGKEWLTEDDHEELIALIEEEE